MSPYKELSMSRAPVFTAEDTVRIVLSVLTGEITVAEVARRAKVSELSADTWKRQFLEAWELGLAPGDVAALHREEQLAA